MPFYEIIKLDKLVKSDFPSHCEEWDSSPVFARLMKSAEAISKQASEQAPQSNKWKHLSCPPIRQSPLADWRTRNDIFIAVMKLKDFYNAEKTVWLKIFTL